MKLTSKLRKMRSSDGASALALRSAAARGITLPIQAVASLATAGVLIRHYGATSYAQYALVISLVAILPFADLGVGAAVVNATADLTTEERLLRAVATIRAAFRALIVIGVFGVLTGLLITYSAGWSTVLGGTFDETGNTAVLVCIILFAFTLPLSLGQRVALGIGANDRFLLIQGLQSILTFALVLTCVNIGVNIQGAFLSFFAAYLVVTGFTSIAANKWSGGLLWKGSVRTFAKADPSVGKISILSTALPMCVVMIGLPFVLQAHRLMLSHFGTPEQVAQYSLAAQMFLPVMALVSAAATSLWSVFARERTLVKTSASAPAASPFQFSLYIALAASALCTAVTLLAPSIAPLISNGQIEIPISLGLCFSAFVVAQAAQVPLGVYLTDVRGLRLQAATTVVFVASAWAATDLLIPVVGAGAPALATGAAGVVVQLVPFAIAVARTPNKVRTRFKQNESGLSAGKGP